MIDALGAAPIAANASNPNDAPPRRELQADTFAASVVLLLATTVIQRAVGFGRGVLFCRWLDPETLGRWEMAYSFLLLAAPLAVLGVPGSFGRYAEHFRQRGQLQAFLKRTSIFAAICTLSAVAVVAVWPEQLAALVFGEARLASLTVGVGFCLGAVMLVNTLTSLLGGLRMYRAVSVVNFVQSMMFAAVSLAILWAMPSAGAIIVGYGVASLVAAMCGIIWLRPALALADENRQPLAHGGFWRKLLRFAFFVWVANFLSNLFGSVDRYMLIHYSGLPIAAAMEQVGCYHSSRVIPLLLVSVADLLSGILVPHLSHDWEQGRREQVGRRLCLVMKLSSGVMVAVGAGVLAFAPWLFHVVFKGKYDGGLAVLPWTLAGCMWYGLISISQSYLWCAERVRLATIPLAVGLAVNVALNFLLLPSLALQGAVISSAIATALTVVAVVSISRRLGMRTDAGTWFALAAPAALLLGVAAAIATLAILAVVAATTNWIFNSAERSDIANFASQACASFLRRFRLRQPAVG